MARFALSLKQKGKTMTTKPKTRPRGFAPLTACPDTLTGPAYGEADQ